MVDSIVDDADYTILWHMGPDVAAISPTPTSSNKGVVRHAWELVTRGGRRLELTITLYSGEAARVRIAEGEKDPYLAWYSSGRLLETPSKVIVIDLPVRGHADVETRLTPIEVER